VKTGQNGYFFDGDVAAEAQIGEMAPEGPPLMPGDHLPTARGFLVERLYINHGIEGWTVRTSQASVPDLRVRVAVSGLGSRRLRREKAVHDAILERAPGASLTLPPDANLAMPFHQTLSWPLSVQTLEEADGASGFLKRLRPAERLALAEAIVSRLERLHETGVVHGDLKAANILLPEGRTQDVRLCGLAHAYVPPRSGHETTSADLALQERDWRRRREDSDHYRAPELPGTLRITELTDIYAAGVLLYKIVAGDMLRPFTANWQEDVSCPVLQADIAAATARDPADRIARASDLLRRLRTYPERRRRHDEALADALKLEQERRRLERHRILRPYYIAVLVLSVSGFLGMAALALQLRASNLEIAVQEGNAAAARDVLKSILVSADPRARPGAPPETIDDVLDRAGESARLAYSGDDGGAASAHLVLADVYRGRGRMDAERDHLQEAVALLEQTGADPARLASAKYALSTSLLMTRPNNGEDPGVYRKQADGEIQEADRLFARLRNPSAELRAARAFAKGNYSSQRGDYGATFTALTPWVDVHLEADLPLDRRGYNTVILFAEAQLRLGDPEAALETLEWLASKETGEILLWLTINRRTLQAQVSDVLGRSDTEDQFLAALELVAEIYAGPALPEANIRHYYANFLEAEGRLAEAETQHRAAQDIFCASGASGLYCEGIGVSVGGIQVKLGKYDEAILNLRRAREVFERDYPAGIPQVNYALAKAHAGNGDMARARDLLSGLLVRDMEAADPRGNWSARIEALNAITSENPDPQDLAAAMRGLGVASVDDATILWFENVSTSLGIAEPAE
jgi:non-specific serine/threonine protein kinase